LPTKRSGIFNLSLGRRHEDFESLGFAPQPIRGDGITYQLPSIDVMRAQEQTVVFHQCVDEERNAPQIVLLVVNADGKNRTVRLNRAASPFDIHLDESGSGFGR